MLLQDIILRPLARDELDIVIDWAAAEDWNPGLNDAEIFWQTDPNGFVGAELDGELIASGSIVSYGSDYGFMGFFIVKPELRGKGIGSRLWFHRRDLLKSRLKPTAAIGMDGVFEMQDWYARGGFKFTHRNLRMQGVATTKGPIASEISNLDSIPFHQVSEYDLECFGCERDKFLKAWIESPNATSLGYLIDGKLHGFGVIRECREGFKIGPLFADDAKIAEALFTALSHHAKDRLLSLDIPEINAEAVEMAKRHKLTEVFGCARMYFGDPPPMNWTKTFGITTLELG